MGSMLRKLDWKIAFVAVVAVFALLATACGQATGARNDVRNALGSATSEQGSNALSSVASSSDDLGSIDLEATTEYLEYSGKTVDPITLVACADQDVKITTEDTIDLGTVGKQTVTYTLAKGNAKAKQKVDFIVRDTKAPSIELGADEASIDQGGSYDPAENIASVKDEVDGDLGRIDGEPEANGKTAGLERFYDDGWYIVTGTVDGNTPGTYPIRITAADKHGNTATREFTVTVNEVVQAPVAAAEPPAPATHSYVLNTNSHKFHNPGCGSVRQMKDSNRMDVEMTREEVLAMGYSPCGKCNP